LSVGLTQQGGGGDRLRRRVLGNGNGRPERDGDRRAGGGGRASGQPDRGDPDAHATFMTKANAANDDKLKPLIKMVKHWSRHNYDRLCSFHVELICADIFGHQTIVNYPIGMAVVLANLPNYIHTTMMDPIYGVSKVNKDLSLAEVTELDFRTKSDAARAVDALKLENNGYHREAIVKWKEIFLSGFPK